MVFVNVRLCSIFNLLVCFDLFFVVWVDKAGKSQALLGCSALAARLTFIRRLTYFSYFL